MNREIDEALNNCLGRIANGETLETCLADYPSDCEELRSLILIAMTTMGISRLVEPSRQSKARNFAGFINAIEQQFSRPQPRIRFPILRFGLAKPILLSLAIIIASTTGIGLTTVASANSVPGEPLYWVKTTKESIQLKIPQSSLRRARAHVDLANTRSQEIRKLISRDQYGIADNVMRRMNDHLGASATYIGVTVTVHPLEMPRGSHASNKDFKLTRFRISLERNVELMRNETNSFISKLTPKQKQQLKHFRRQSEFTYRMLIDAMSEYTIADPLGIASTLPYQSVLSR